MTIQVVLSRGAGDAVRRGHPWVFREPSLSRCAANTGDEVVLTCDGSALGRGIYDAASPIAVRLWTRGEPIDGELIRARASEAMAARSFDADTTAFRWIHGEGDRMPGIVVDRYGEVAVLRLDGEAIATRLEAIVGATWPLFRAHVKTLLLRHTERGGEKTTRLEGPPAPSENVVAERGVKFVVDVLRGQKTGAFLDQRENRVRVGAMARGKRVLNLFSYAGGFSLHAALGGATHVTSVDVAAQAHATAQASFRASEVDPSRHAFVTADVHGFLDAARGRGDKWDLVISDPPSFAPSEKAVPKALAAYRALHAACVRVLAPGGTFCASSCSSHVGAQRFLSTLDDVALGRSDLRMLGFHGLPSDHPTLPAWPEGAYLKLAILR